MKEKEIEYVDLRFTDPKGKLQHVTMDAKIVDDEMLNEGIFFDGYLQYLPVLTTPPSSTVLLSKS